MAEASFLARHGRALAVATALALVPVVSAQAGTGGTEFEDIYTLITDWSQGFLGRILALGIILVGLGIAVVSRSMLPIAGGIVAALVLFTAPTVIDGILTVTLAADGAVLTLPAVEQVVARA